MWFNKDKPSKSHVSVKIWPESESWFFIGWGPRELRWITLNSTSQNAPGFPPIRELCPRTHDVREFQKDSTLPLLYLVLNPAGQGKLLSFSSPRIEGETAFLSITQLQRTHHNPYDLKNLLQISFQKKIWCWKWYYRNKNKGEECKDSLICTACKGGHFAPLFHLVVQYKLN